MLPIAGTTASKCRVCDPALAGFDIVESRHVPPGKVLHTGRRIYARRLRARAPRTSPRGEAVRAASDGPSRGRAAPGRAAEPRGGDQ